MNYAKHYILLVLSRQEMKRVKNGGDYESHHIIPRCMGGDNSNSNLVILTPREHYVAHWLLFKMSKGKVKAKMAYAFFKMCQRNPQQKRCLTSRMFDTARKAVSKTCNGENAPGYGRKWSPERKKQRSLDMVGDNNPMWCVEPWNKGSTKETNVAIREKVDRWRLKYEAGEYTHYTNRPPRSEEFKQKISQLHKGVPKSQEHKHKLSEINKGKRLSDETKKKMSLSRKGRNVPLVECPHCGKCGGFTAMKRWHFDNCKFK